MSHTTTELTVMAQAISKSQLFGIKTQEQAMALMLVAEAEGRHPATIVQDYDIIQGRPAIKANAALARFQQSGGKIQWHERTDFKASCTFTHPMGGESTITWDIDRAKRAELTGKDNWRKFTAQMLSARVVAEGVRAVFPACLNGFYLPEEVQDFKEVRQAESAPEPPTQVIEPTLKQKRDMLISLAKKNGFTDDAISAVLGDDWQISTLEQCKKLNEEVKACIAIRNEGK